MSGEELGGRPGRRCAVATGSWEYRLVTLYLRDHDSRARGIGELNRLGQSGWDAISTELMENVEFPQEGPVLHVLLKRHPPEGQS